jgi:hypothetical protein
LPSIGDNDVNQNQFPKEKTMKTLKNVLLAATIAVAGITATADSAAAYVVCNRFGDCWHTDTRVHFPGVRLTFHADSWWDHHKANRHYTWHELDSSRDWHHGYWDHGTWHTL